MSGRAKSPPAKGKGKAEATPEELAAAEAARLSARADTLEAEKAKEASDRNYAQLERVRAQRMTWQRRAWCCGMGHASCGSRLAAVEMRLAPSRGFVDRRAAPYWCVLVRLAGQGA